MDKSEILAESMQIKSLFNLTPHYHICIMIRLRRHPVRVFRPCPARWSLRTLPRAMLRRLPFLTELRQVLLFQQYQVAGRSVFLNNYSQRFWRTALCRRPPTLPFAFSCGLKCNFRLPAIGHVLAIHYASVRRQTIKEKRCHKRSSCQLKTCSRFSGHIRKKPWLY